MDNKQTYYDRVKYAVQMLNAIYGKGNCSVVKLFMDGHGTFVQTPYGCKPCIRRFRINSQTVYACRHQRKLI